MATASISVKQLNDITECPICTEVFKDPRVLPCIHTYCLQCIGRWCRDKEPGDKVDCPLCRTVFTIPQGGVSGLPKHFFIQKLLTLGELGERASPEKNQCDCCSADGKAKSATVYCVECQEKMCEDCNEAHRKLKATRSHKVVKIGEAESQKEVASNLQSANCDKHPRDDIRLYCFDCKVAICLMCFAEEHNSHKCSAVEKVAQEFRQQIERDNDRNLSAAEKSQEMMRELKKEKNDFIGQISRVEKEICEHAEKLKQTIERHKQTVLHELEDKKHTRLKEIETASEEIERHLVAVESLKKYSEELLSKGTACDIVRAASGLHDRTDELQNSKQLQQQLRHVIDVTFTSSEFIIIDNAKKAIGELEFIAKNEIEDTLSEWSTSFNISPTLTHEITSKDGVSAVTSLGSQVFIASGEKNEQQVEVYDAETLTLQCRLAVPGLSLSFGLAACRSNNCLYVADYKSSVVHRVELSSNSAETKWSVATAPAGLSVTSKCNVLVTCFTANKLQEFTTHGTPVREISLEASLHNPWHAVQLQHGNFVLSCKSSVSLVGTDGRAIQCYPQTDSKHEQLNGPRSLSVTKNGSIFVADQGNKRILLFDPSLISAIQLQLYVHAPRGLCQDESRDRLYVAQWAKEGRLLVFNVNKAINHSK